MRAFQDGQGRAWEVALDVWRIKQVAARTGFQVGRMLDDGMAGLRELAADPVKFVDVLFVLCAGQAETRGVTEEGFFGALAGDPLEAAYEAFRGAFEDFSPRHLRTLLRASSAKAKVATERAVAKALKEIETDEGEAGDRPTSSPSATSAPASPASIPAG